MGHPNTALVNAERDRSGQGQGAPGHGAGVGRDGRAGLRGEAGALKDPLPDLKANTLTKQPLPNNRYQTTVTKQPLPNNRYSSLQSYDCVEGD